MIDLHSHTTASDGRSSPDELVREAAAAGVRVLAVTDHDTVAAVPEVAAAAAASGLGFVPGIEITAVHEGIDVHVLGYYLDPDHLPLQEFLTAQRRDRLRRLAAIVARLAAIGAPVDVPELTTAADATGRAFGRPLAARALVAAGHAASIADAFDRYLSPGRPAFVEREGESPANVVAVINAAGGLASLAHPGKAGRDDLVPSLAAAGLAAIEAFHPDHTPDDVRRYRTMAGELGLLVTGGSDYHGEGSGRASHLGRVGLPAAEFARVAAAARQLRTDRHTRG